MKKVELDKEDQQYVEEVLDELSDVFKTHVDALVQLEGKSAFSALSVLLRPFIKTSYIGETANEVEFRDNRTRDWSVKVYIWDMGNGAQAGELEHEYSAEICNGMVEVGKWMRDAMQEHHGVEPDHLKPFTERVMKQRMGGMHAAVSKGGGKASTRIKYVHRGTHYMMQANVLRHDAETA